MSDTSYHPSIAYSNVSTATATITRSYTTRMRIQPLAPVAQVQGEQTVAQLLLEDRE